MDILNEQVVDTRTIIEELESYGVSDWANTPVGAYADMTPEDLLQETGIDAENVGEIDLLLEVLELAGDNAGDEPQDGITLINDVYFVEYAEELAEDIGAVNRDNDWPLTFIDWDAAAEALKVDYSSFTVDGTTFWCR